MNTTLLDFSTPHLDLSQKTILIIDDYQEMRSIFREFLRNFGADIKKRYAVANGSEAIVMLKKVQFDIVLCDLNLGSGKNGQQVLEEAKYCSLIEPSCLWIMISAEKTSDAVTGAAEYQPDAYFTEACYRNESALAIIQNLGKKRSFCKNLPSNEAIRLPESHHLM